MGEALRVATAGAFPRPTLLTTKPERILLAKRARACDTVKGHSQ